MSCCESTVSDDCIPSDCEMLNLEAIIIQQLRQLYHSGTGTDITIVVCGKVFTAHRLILATRSEYFYAMLETGFRESKQQTIVIDDCEPEDFELLLEYIYYGRVLFRGFDDLIRLFLIADRFMLNGLYSRIQYLLCASYVNSANMISLYQVALKCNNLQLERLAFKCMLLNGHLLLQDSSLFRFPIQEILKLLTNDLFCCFENDIARFVFRYLEQNLTEDRRLESTNNNNEETVVELSDSDIVDLLSTIRHDSINAYDKFKVQSVVLYKRHLTDRLFSCRTGGKHRQSHPSNAIFDTKVNGQLYKECINSITLFQFCLPELTSVHLHFRHKHYFNQIDFITEDFVFLEAFAQISNDGVKFVSTQPVVVRSANQHTVSICFPVMIYTEYIQLSLDQAKFMPRVGRKHTNVFKIHVRLSDSTC